MKTAIATATVLDHGLAALNDKIGKLNRKAAKHGMSTVSVEVVKTLAFFPIHRDKKRVRRFGHQRDMFVVEICGDAPRIDGWELIAKVDFTPSIGTVVKISPGCEDDGSFEQYRDHDGMCEHCNSRRRRNDVFVLQHADKGRKVVGRNCLADFLRTGDASAFARFAECADRIAEIVGSLDDDEMSGGGGGGYMPREMDLGQYLAIVAMLTRRLGWVSRSAARESYEPVSSTANDAQYYLFDNSADCKKWIAKNELFADENDAKRALAAIGWALGVDDKGNEYLNVIKRIAQSGKVTFDMDGYAASILVAFDKANEREIAYRNRADKRERVHYGTPKKREKGLPVKCVGLHSYEGNYGVSTIVRFELGVSETEKAILVWFASGDRYSDWELDGEYLIDATPKKHDDDEKYGKDTKINRVKDVTPK